ncbi:UNKNOWN [Stylonychia lemnae]|uniref:Uncharacterized protein n=1 Tax=Stylonychia lemnae TaxID=5949 RepID=A0A078A3V2_STYLE|nr:UNKNOWN [Stylonychia lemnae]|eukprot:CDW75434.1 UNKNOWN [Stylonychia lemnae]
MDYYKLKPKVISHSRIRSVLPKSTVNKDISNLYQVPESQRYQRSPLSKQQNGESFNAELIINSKKNDFQHYQSLPLKAIDFTLEISNQLKPLQTKLQDLKRRQKDKLIIERHQPMLTRQQSQLSHKSSSFGQNDDLDNIELPSLTNKQFPIMPALVIENQYQSRAQSLSLIKPPTIRPFQS